MNCQLCEEYMMKYFDNDINDIEQAQLRQHLKVCKSCNNSYEEMTAVFGIMGSEGDIEPPADFEASVMHKLKNLEEVRVKHTNRLLFGLYALATAALGILTFVIIFKLQDNVLEAMASAGAKPGVMSVLYLIVKKFYDLTNIIIKGATQIGTALSGVYYYLILAFALAYLITRPDLIGLKRNKHEESEQPREN